MLPSATPLNKEHCAEMHWENPIEVPQSLPLRLFGEPRGPNSV